MVGVAGMTIHNYEIGNAYPPLDVARRLADVMELTLDDLWPE